MGVELKNAEDGATEAAASSRRTSCVGERAFDNSLNGSMTDEVVDRTLGIRS